MYIKGTKKLEEGLTASLRVLVIPEGAVPPVVAEVQGPGHAHVRPAQAQESVPPVVAEVQGPGHAHVRPAQAHESVPL
jgi:hypothetical protein